MKPLVICQPRSKFDMFIFVVSYTMCSILFFSLTQKVGNFQTGEQTRMKLWYRCKKVLINQVFDSTLNENIKKTRETITPIVDTKKLSVKIFHGKATETAKNYSELGKVVLLIKDIFRNYYRLSQGRGQKP